MTKLVIATVAAFAIFSASAMACDCKPLTKQETLKIYEILKAKSSDFKKCSDKKGADNCIGEYSFYHQREVQKAIAQVRK